jgi:hypothetical protein
MSDDKTPTLGQAAAPPPWLVLTEVQRLQRENLELRERVVDLEATTLGLVPRFVQIATAMCAIALPMPATSDLIGVRQAQQGGTMIKMLSTLSAIDAAGGVWIFREDRKAWAPVPAARLEADVEPEANGGRA